MNNQVQNPNQPICNQEVKFDVNSNKSKNVLSVIRAKLLRIFVYKYGLLLRPNFLIGNEPIADFVYTIAWHKFVPLRYIYGRLCAFTHQEKAEILSKLLQWEEKGLIDFSGDRVKFRVSERLRKMEYDRF